MIEIEKDRGVKTFFFLLSPKTGVEQDFRGPPSSLFLA
jgi:hypothetical protein